MLKKINRILRMVGLNLVRAKRKKPLKWSGRIVTTTENPEPEWQWQHILDNPPNEGKTHFVGDDCVPPHPEWETSGGTTTEQNEARFGTPRDNKITGQPHENTVQKQ